MTENLLNKFKSIEENYKVIIENVSNAAAKSGRSPENITVLAATKTVSPELINHSINSGVNCIGENRVQELLSKYDNLNLKDTKVHFIGHLQTNKVKQVVPKVDMIESVDSIKLAKEIDSVSCKLEVKTDILIQVNIGRDLNKSGVYEEDLYELIENVSKMPNINIRGLMTIPPICKDKTDREKNFLKMNKLFVDIVNKKLDNVNMDFLSMGMSDDYIKAIEHGSNLIRVGSALYGERIYKKGILNN